MSNFRIANGWQTNFQWIRCVCENDLMCVAIVWVRVYLGPIDEYVRNVLNSKWISKHWNWIYHTTQVHVAGAALHIHTRTKMKLIKYLSFRCSGKWCCSAALLLACYQKKIEIRPRCEFMGMMCFVSMRMYGKQWTAHRCSSLGANTKSLLALHENLSNNSRQTHLSLQ